MCGVTRNALNSKRKSRTASRIKSNLVWGVTRIAFDRKGEALEKILMKQMEFNLIIMALHLFEKSV